MKTAKLSDGTTLSFPDETPDDVMDSAVQKHIESSALSSGGSARMSIPGRIAQGMADPMIGAAQLLGKGIDAVIPGSEIGKNTSEFWNKKDSEYNDLRKQSGQEGIDWSRMAGNIASPLTIASTAIPGLSMATKPKMLAAALKGTGMGAVGGATTLSKDDGTDFWGNKADQIKSGTLMGGVATPALSKAAQIAKPAITSAAQKLIDSNITPTIGTMLGGGAERLESKMMSSPIIGDFITSARKRGPEQLNTAAFNRALFPIGSSADEIGAAPGRDGIGKVRQFISDKYNQLLPKLSFIPDEQVGQEMAALKEMSVNLAPKEAAEFERRMGAHFSRMSESGGMTGEQFKQLDNAIGGDVSKFSSSSDPYHRELGDAFHEAQNILRKGLERSNPEYKGELSKLNEAWANYSVIRKAGQMATAQEGFSPSQLATAVRANNNSVGKGQFAEGKALMQDLSDAGLSLNTKYPDSGTEGRRQIMNLVAALAGGGATATGHLNPLAIAGGAASVLPYTEIGGKLAVKAMAGGNPQTRQKIADVLRKSIPYEVQNMQRQRED